MAVAVGVGRVLNARVLNARVGGHRRACGLLHLSGKHFLHV